MSRKTVVISIVILAVVGIVSIYIWESHNRYYMMVGSDGIIYEIDRRTGKSWALYGDQKIPIEECKSEDKQKVEEEIPPYIIDNKIEGRASLRRGIFSGELYNGSDWVITRMIVNIAIRDKDGSISWSRKFSIDLYDIDPLTTGTFSKFVGEVSVDKKYLSWGIDKMFGYKKNNSQ